uniref:Uncharacterized protein n=1 Tax=Oryza coarctata TaxID=77588 RepID=C0JAB3_ORYCO|nr:unknown [Oryza coarctata]
MPNIPGIEQINNSDSALDLPSRLEKIVIVGGYIALKFVGVFNGLKGYVNVFFSAEECVVKKDTGAAGRFLHDLKMDCIWDWLVCMLQTLLIHIGDALVEKL